MTPRHREESAEKSSYQITSRGRLHHTVYAPCLPCSVILCIYPLLCMWFLLVRSSSSLFLPCLPCLPSPCHIAPYPHHLATEKHTFRNIYIYTELSREINTEMSRQGNGMAMARSQKAQRGACHCQHHHLRWRQGHVSRDRGKQEERLIDRKGTRERERQREREDEDERGV